MKHMTKLLAMLFLGGVATLTACKKEVKTSADEISQETLAKIAAVGFSTTDVQKVDEGYLVEGDIILTEADLIKRPSSPTLRIAEEEQYCTNNLVTGLPHAITVSSTGNISSALSVAIDDAIKRYNDQNLKVTFSRVTSGGDINVSIINTGQYIASSGFPDSQGNPYRTIKYAKKYSNYSNGFMTTVIAHEMGHCIGFRHTDYMNRSYSCGIGGNEGDGGVGANLIPGTASGPDAASWMLACLSSSTNRPFNSNDILALNYLY
ncbi:MAG: protease [Bacteroidetes bacterium]|nr:MAG: protease [Bacteroidota bacterium]